MTGPRARSGGTSSRSPRTVAGGSPGWRGPRTRSSCVGSAPTSPSRPHPAGTRSATVPPSRSGESRWSATAASSSVSSRARRPQRSAAHRWRGRGPPRRCPARAAARHRRERALAGAGACRRAPRRRRSRPSCGREGRCSREVRPSAVSPLGRNQTDRRLRSLAGGRVPGRLCRGCGVPRCQPSRSPSLGRVRRVNARRRCPHLVRGSTFFCRAFLSRVWTCVARTQARRRGTRPSRRRARL